MMSGFEMTRRVLTLRQTHSVQCATPFLKNERTNYVWSPEITHGIVDGCYDFLADVQILKTTEQNRTEFELQRF